MTRLSLHSDDGESDLGRIRFLLEKPVDWEAVLRLADNHGTSSLLYQNLSRFGDVVPSPVLASLRQRYEKNVHKSLFLARELMRILDCLDGLGIEVIPYKGVVLSEVYYGDMALRQTGDIDLFVRRRDVARSKSALRDLGYTTRLVIPEDAEEDYMLRDMSGRSTVPRDRTCWNCSGLCSRASTRSTLTWRDCLSAR